MNESLNALQETLEKLVMGLSCQPIATDDDNKQLGHIVELVNILSANLTEANQFAKRLSEGKLSTTPPGRHNYLAANLKELHSQLISFCWSAQQLVEGRIVGHQEFMGELSASLNGLIAKVSEQNALASKACPLPEDFSANSWRYHQLLTAFNSLDIMIIETQADGRVLFCNLLAMKLLGRFQSIQDLVMREDAGIMEKNLSALHESSGPFPVSQEVFDSRSDTWYRFSVTKIVLPDEHAGFLYTIEDISIWKNSERELKMSASTDSLTGTLNRNTGLKTLEQIISPKSPDVFHCVSFLDIDNLKKINDTYGHNEGDYAIRTIAQVLLSHTHEHDTVSRFGGDEFLLIFQNCKLITAEQMIYRMHKKLEQISRVHGKPYPLSFSHGTVQISYHSRYTAQELILLMDKKMYERKRKKAAQNVGPQG